MVCGTLRSKQDNHFSQDYQPEAIEWFGHGLISAFESELR
jgi:hypothetical protein